MGYYEQCCNGRLQDLIRWVSQVFPGQTINGDYVFRNARLQDIARGSWPTQRVINWCRNKLEEIGEKEKARR